MSNRYPEGSLEKRLAAYSLAAGATLFALAPATADAQIVYTDLDPDETVTTGSEYGIDFDADGTDDVTFVIDAPSATFTRARVFANEDNNGGIVGFGPVVTNYQYFYASVVDDGTSIDGTNTIDNSNVGTDGNRDDFLLTSTFGGASYGNWAPGEGGPVEGIVGVRFNTGAGTTHYAWVRLAVNSVSEVVISEYAFESNPDTPIAAGAIGVASEPGALADGYLFSEVAPNPIASGRASFELAVGAAETVSVDVFDSLGRRVQTAFTGAMVPGATQTVNLDTSALPAGVYVVRVSGESFVSTRNVTVVR